MLRQHPSLDAGCDPDPSSERKLDPKNNHSRVKTANVSTSKTVQHHQQPACPRAQHYQQSDVGRHEAEA